MGATSPSRPVRTGLRPRSRRARLRCSISPRPVMNIHHLELFYYVAKHGGISAAVRHIPYGIQQPAVSGQMRLLEQGLGVRLFERTPFRLSAEGLELFKFVEPFFAHLEPMTARLRKTSVPQLRVGASELVLRDHLPEVIRQLRTRHPRLRLGLRSGRQPQLEAWLLDRQIDLAITLMDGRPSPRLRRAVLMRLPMVLLVPKASRYRSVAELWAQGQVDEPLISLPGFEVFQNALRRIGVDWPTAIEAGSLELVTQYVANGYGIGVSNALPKLIRHPKVRVLPLPEFPPAELACLWLGRPIPLIEEVLETSRRYVAEHWPQWVVAAPAG